jgi:hypothetical protein
LEALESRLLLSASLIGVPDWSYQGPAPILNGSSTVPPDNPVTGAVQSIAINPNNVQQIYVGSVNGGVWRTNNADPANPGAVTWTSLTEQMPSLAIGAIEFSRLDASGNTLYAGTGRFSNLFSTSGPAVGILRTIDGGATWQNFAVNPGNEGRIKAVIATGIDTDPGAGAQEMVLVGAIDGGGGVFRSDDGGQAFTLLSGANGLPTGAVSQLIQDPNNINVFYAALPGQGVFQGTLAAGVITWVAVNTGINPGNIASSANIQIAAQNNAGATILFAALADAPPANSINSVLTDVLTSIDNGTTWTTIGTPAPFNPWSLSGSGMNLIADPANAGSVYIGGLAGTGNLYRFDPGAPGAWVSIIPAAAGTEPHADSRDMAFIGNDILVQSDDGGIYFLQNPTNAAANQWQSFIGETSTGQALGGVEVHDIAWDSNSDILITGAQDNGTEVQQTTGDLVWTSIFGSDGGDVLVDNFTLAGANQSIRYFSAQNLGSFSRQVFDSNNSPVGGQVGMNTGGLAGFVGQFITPTEINTIAPPAGQSTRIVIGGGTNAPAITVGAVYESTDAGTAAVPTWTQVTLGAGAAGGVSAFAYGGRLNGVDNPDVLYIGIGGAVFVRTTAGGTANATATPFPDNNVQDITLDPNDWRHAFVASSAGVWETTDAGATWMDRSGNIAGVTTNIRTIEFAEQGGVDAVLVGGLGGVFRMLTDDPGVWSEFGADLPNAVTFDLEYNVADDILVAGTFGQGAWTIDNASDFLTVEGALQIFGDEDFLGQDDTIRLVIDEANPSLLDVFINGELSQFQLSVIQQLQIDVFSLGGNDTLIVDSSFGLINVAGGTRYYGGDGSDALRLEQTDGPTRVSDTYSVGPAIGSGVSTIDGGGTAGKQVVFFEDLEPVVDLVPAAQLTVNATPTGNTINYSVGTLVTTGLVSVDEHETIEFSNHGLLIINAGAGADTINLSNANTPTDLTEITINGGDPDSGDILKVTGAGTAVTVNTATGAITGASGASGEVSIGYGGIEALDLAAGIGDLTIATTGADDTAVVTPGLAAGANSGTVTSSGAVPQITFVNSGSFSALLGGGDDTVIVNASADADTIAASGTAVAITGRRAIGYTGAEHLTVNGSAGSDTVNVTPSSAVAIFVDGGDPIGVKPGDLLNILAGGDPVTFNAGPETDEGNFAVGANQPVSFDHIESLAIDGSGPAVINGTNGPDAITVIARDASTHGGADGVQDFTVSVNTGPDLLFLNVDSLTVNALSGSDQVTLQTPAPNNAAWDVDVTVNGGPPAADTDQLIVQTPGAAAETVVYTPNAPDGGTLDLSSLSSLVKINTIETLTYDGQNDGDSLTVGGTGGNDVIVHNPGANDQAGSFLVNSLLSLGYLNLGSGGSLVANGGAGDDTLVYNGTAANDSFTIGAAGQVALNARLVVDTAGIETLTLQGFAGDDSFTLVPAISATGYTTINLNGGDQASATGDRVFLIGTVGNDDIVVSGQSVSLGGRTVNGSGIEDIRLDALGGDDRITYNGVAGVTETITVGSSGAVGGGQISIPAVALVNFSGVERIVVNGNVPGPSETDTLTFAGTNAVDTFTINLVAAGTSIDPVLRLQNGSLLLTLENYTNFNTLRVLGLDGADTFNVNTAAGPGTGRNLFVDGGLPTGKKKSTDNLNIFYTPPRPSIIHSTETQDHDSGIVDLDYGTARFVVQYDDVEQIVIRKN